MFKDSKQNEVPAGIMTDHHIALPAYKRIEAITDENSFVEFDKGMTSANPLDFPGYQEKN